MKEFVIEVLYPEFNNLFGDRGNLEYLVKKLSPSYDVKILETSLYEKPHFIDENVDILLIGPCTEKSQALEAAELIKYKNEIKARMDSDRVTLATGNAFELFGQYIAFENGEKFDALGFFDYHSERFTRLRYNDKSVGCFEDMKVVGFKNLLSHSYGENNSPLFKMEKGCGMNKETDKEGIHVNNFFATYLIGPILPLNPAFTDYLIRLCDSEYKPFRLKFEDKAYESRLKELTK